MSGSAVGRIGVGRGIRAAGIAGLAAPVLWTIAAAMEVARANIGHSIFSRPERFFSDGAWHWPLVLIVALMVGAQLAATSTLLMSGPRRQLAIAVGALFGVAGLARLALTLLLPSDPHGYSVSPAAALCSNVVLLTLPLGLLTTAVLMKRRSPALAWLSGGIAVAITWISLWATVWAARSGASEPQLLAIEPAEGLASIWVGVVGVWLLGRRLPLHLPDFGRKSGVAVALAACVAIIMSSGSFVAAYRPTIEAQLTGRTSVETIHANAVDRTYRLHRPAKVAAAPGLVIVLHGSFGGGFQIEADSGFDVEADRLGWIAAYPDGVADGWDAFGSTDKWGRHPGADDVTFISALIDRLEASDAVDPNRVYVTGMSRGGMMSYRLGCALSDRLAAIAPVSGNMATESGSADVPCTLNRPVSVLAIHGTADGTIPVNGGKVDITFSPMTDVIARWRAMDQCGAASTQSADGPSATTTWACLGGSSVVTRVVNGGWHTWPKISGAAASQGGSPDSFDAARLIADFFVAHPKVTS
jgi:polyhydroxybutyrate depolymerase